MTRKYFKSLKLKAQAVKCYAIDVLLKEAEGILQKTKPCAVRDAGIIAASQKVEHYEIASYGTLGQPTYKILGEKEALKILLEPLKEEKNCDNDLSKLAKTEISLKAK